MYSTISSKDAILRPYQQEAKDSIFSTWDNVSSIMLQMPTGTGKTILFSSIIKDIHNWMIKTRDIKKILIIVHRTELIEQTKEKLGMQYHVASGVIAGNYTLDLKPQVQIASIQTLTHPAKEYLANNLNVGFIIIDEAHHALAASYQKLWSLYPEAKKLGVTATPWRMNHAGFTDLFDKLIQSWTIRKFIEKKYLAKFQYYSIKPSSEEQKAIDGITEFDIEGDYKISAMENAMDNGHIRANLLESYQKYAKGKRGIIYAITRTHGKKICADFQKAGVNIDYIDSSTKPQDRKTKVEKFRKGEIEVLVNVDIFSEGFDCPALDFVQMARPTRSLVKYLQQVGRALRPNGNKRAIILDNVGMFKRFGLPDANRKWSYHFKGIDVEESGCDGVQDSEYTSNVRRLNDLTEGSEEMVLLNGKAIEIESETDPEISEIVSKPSFVDQMVEKLDLLGIQHGKVTTSNGLMYDLLETDGSYIYRQISIKYNLRYNNLLTIPKDSVLGRLCKEFGSCFSPIMRVDSVGNFYYEDGLLFILGDLTLHINDQMQLCHNYDEQNKPIKIGNFEEIEFDRSKFSNDLQKYLQIPKNPLVEKKFNSILKYKQILHAEDIFYLGENAYMMLISDKNVSIKKLILEKDHIKSVLVSRAKKDTYLYNSCKLYGTEAIRYINHYGGHFSFIIFASPETGGSVFSSYAGEYNGPLYEFESENTYLYAKSIGSESTEDSVTVIDLNNDLKSALAPVIKEVSVLKSPSISERMYSGYDMAHRFQTRQKNGDLAYGYYNPNSKNFIIAKGCCFPVVVSTSFSRSSARNTLIATCTKQIGDFYYTTRDYQLDSASTAASIIKGYSANGFVDWKTSDGKTIKEIYK